MMAVRTNNFKIAQMLWEHAGNEGVLFRMDWQQRNILDLLSLNTGKRPEVHRQKKDTKELVKKMMYRDLAEVLQQIASAKENDNVPYLPDAIVRCISIMTY